MKSLQTDLHICSDPARQEERAVFSLNDAGSIAQVYKTYRELYYVPYHCKSEKGKTVKLLEVNKGEYLHDILEAGQDFLSGPPEIP